MEREPLTEDQVKLVSTAILYGPFPPKPEYLADAHHLYERGWFDRRSTKEHLVFALSARGVHALELGIPLGEAKEAMN